jgi:type IX secretion system PorP/SprF family membrane protein
MRLTKHNILFSFLLLGSCFLYSQDIHFSQFNNSPLNLNPGLIGAFEGEFRFVGNQRTQWSSVTTPYSTFSISADAKRIFKSPFGVGLSVYNDKAGDSDFSTTQIGLGGTYSIYLKDSSQTLIFGVQPAFVQRSINYDKLQFDNQYNGSVFDENLGNGESFNNAGRNYFNLHGGVSWNYKIAQRKSVAAGIAVHNIISPKQTFFSDNTIRLKPRLTIHTNGLFKVSDKVDVLPSIMYGKQHKFQEIIFGGSGKYHLNNGNYKAVYAGVWYRNSDASYFTVGLDYSSFHFGVSYDLNLSSLEVASNKRGGFEFAIIYIIERYRPKLKRYKACPDYL